MAVDYLNSLGVGSGLNTTEIIDALVEAERAPQENQITAKREQRTVEISGLGQVKSGFEGFSTGMAPVDGVTGLVASATSSDISIEIGDMANASSFAHTMTVSQIAAAQTLVFDGYSGETASVGTGSLTLEFGSWAADETFSANADRSDVTVNLSTGTGTLSGLRDAINASGADVTASILKTAADSYALVIRSREGANHAMRISATEDANARGLAAFTYEAVDSDVESVAAADATFTLDGTTITRDTNEVEDLIDGVTLTLNAASDSASRISAEYDTVTAKAAMQMIVDSMNDLMTTLSDMGRRSLTGEEDGPLAGDPLLRTLQRQLKSYTTTAIPGFQDDPVYLTQFGVKTQRDGSLTLDLEEFEAAFEANPDKFAAITNSRITSSSGLVIPEVVGTDPVAGVYSFDLAGDGSATLNGDAMAVSNGRYGISDTDAGGLTLTLANSGADASIYVGTSLIDTLSSFAEDVLAMNSDLDLKISRYNEDLGDYDDELADLDEQIDSLRARYVEQFSAMNSTIAQFKETETSLTNMMDAWRASLEG